MSEKQSYSKCRDYKHHKSRRKSPDYSARPKKPRSSSPTTSHPEERPVNKYKHELSKFLAEQANIHDQNDFWKFFDKYEAIQAARKGTALPFDRKKLINIDFEMDLQALYEKLPVLDRNGERMLITRGAFANFLHTIKVYQDFQQKAKFGKLKKLRKVQEELPIAKYREEIVSRLETSRVVLIAGDTGCGKSTQVPQYVMEAGYTKIVCTQPRRIACVSLAKRVAQETLTDYKTTVGYQIRFEKTKCKDTAIVFMTEGLLLRQAAEEDTLKAYDVIILDEIHERHLHGDFLIGIMKCLLHKRGDFKLILMSATINLKLFSDYFAQEDVQVVQVPGRLYPIDIKYHPIVRDPYEKKRDRFDCTPYLQIVQMIDEKYSSKEKGDLLVFLNGFSEISTLAEAVTEYSQIKRNWIVLQLHSSLSLEEQDKVFDYPPEGVRKCIISTNIAETSVTIDGIRFVIDSGKVNRMTYNTYGGFNKLAETTISQDSAKQRAGRAGRTGPGICHRMYSEEDFKNFEPFTPAEIHLVPLESLMLHMISLGLTDISNFPFLEKPSAKSIEESLEKLKFCGALALDRDGLYLTQLGDALSNLPVDLAIGKMLVMSTVFGNVNSVLALAALLSVQSPLTQTAYRNLDAQEMRKPLESNHGDPITLLNLYKEWLSVKQQSTPVGKHRSENSRTWTKKRCLEEQRFYEVTKLTDQFRDILVEANLMPKESEAELSSAERAIRHGELKQLKSMRYKLRNESKSSQRKQLKYEMYEDEEKSNQKLDLRDVEFRITNDFKRLQRLLDETTADSYKDLMLLKLILTSGLYPQIAVEDEFNSSKTVADRLYHTKNKNYVFLRPTSFFATNPEILELHNDDIEVPPPGYFSKRPVSRKHQVLVYQSILETKKVYLMNVMRMPALQTLLLFSKTIGTNSTLTKMIFDDFLAVDVPYYGQGKTVLLRALQLRKKWTEKLGERLNDPGLSSRVNKEEIFYFVEDLVKFMSTEVSYNVKRLLPADLKTLYNRDVNFFEAEKLKNIRNPFDESFSIHPNAELGGVNVTENVVYNCLTQEDWAYDLEEQLCNTPYECAACGVKEIGRNFLWILEHEKFCSAKSTSAKEDSGETSAQSVAKPNSKQFHCDKCDKDLFLSPVDILKHKKTCVAVLV